MIETRTLRMVPLGILVRPKPTYLLSRKTHVNDLLPIGEGRPSLDSHHNNHPKNEGAVFFFFLVFSVTHANKCMGASCDNRAVNAKKKKEAPIVSVSGEGRKQLAAC